MKTQTFELQAVTDEELLDAAGGGPHFTSKKSFNADLQALEARDHGLQSLLMPRSRTVATMG